MKTKRQSNIELLRMLSMLMILTMHMINHGGLLWAPILNRTEYTIVWSLFGFGFCSINLYLLISSYYLCKSKFSIYRIVKMAVQVITYSLLITLIFWLFTDVEHDKKYLIYSCLPIMSDFYWFVSMYVGMYILSPVMNKLLHTLSKRQLQFTIAVSLLLTCVWPNVIYFSSAMNTAGGVSISWFLTIYLIGGYIRLYYEPTGNWLKPLFAACFFNILLPVSKLFVEYLLTTSLKSLPFLDDMLWGYSIFYTYSSIPVTIASVFMFTAFLNIRIENPIASNVINLLSSCSFGVYLLHDHFYTRERMWAVIDAPSWIGHWYLFPLCIITIIMIYLIGSFIEKVRQALYLPLISSPRLKEMCSVIDSKINSFWE